MSNLPNYQTVLDFWFGDEARPFWFAKSDEFDHVLHSRFLTTLEYAKRGELDDWRDDIKGRLAEIIVLDQFSRNIYRDTPSAFAQDGIALVLAQEAINLPAFADLSEEERNFVLLPFMHSESKMVHDKALPYFQKCASEHTLDFEYKHKAIIDRFGRYPHRNAILGRTSTAEELAFLDEPNSSF